MSKNLPVLCPACQARLSVEKLNCSQCGTTIQGDFPIPLFLQLSYEEQDFILNFLKASGSLKEMARQLGYSYPKVRNMLDDIISKVNQVETKIQKDLEK